MWNCWKAVVRLCGSCRLHWSGAPQKLELHIGVSQHCSPTLEIHSGAPHWSPQRTPTLEAHTGTPHWSRGPYHVVYCVCTVDFAIDLTMDATVGSRGIAYAQSTIESTNAVHSIRAHWSLTLEPHTGAPHWSPTIYPYSGTSHWSPHWKPTVELHSEASTQYGTQSGLCGVVKCCGGGFVGAVGFTGAEGSLHYAVKHTVKHTVKS